MCHRRMEQLNNLCSVYYNATSVKQEKEVENEKKTENKKNANEGKKSEVEEVQKTCILAAKEYIDSQMSEENE